ncbi:MAG: hypothetical protein ABIN58_03640 [candidate division WOR-3 bacterium]
MPMMVLSVISWTLVSTDTIRSAVVSENLAVRAEVHSGDPRYFVSVSTPSTTWQIDVDWKPGTDIQVTDDGCLVLTQGKRLSVYRDAKLSWSMDIGNGLPLVLGDRVLINSNQGVVVYFTSGSKPVGEYEVIPPMDISESMVAGIWNGRLRLYRDKMKEWPLPYEYPRFIEICGGGIAVAFPHNLVFFSFAGKKLWDKDLPVSTSALHFGGGLIWVAGTDMGTRKAILWAFSEGGEECYKITYSDPDEPAFVSNIYCDSETLRVFVSRVLHTYKP